MIQLATFSDLRQHRQRVKLDGVRYEIELTWRDRTASWYLSIFTDRGELLAASRRLRPSWSPLELPKDERLPPGLLYVDGPSEYTREDLGRRLRLLYFPISEVAP